MAVAARAALARDLRSVRTRDLVGGLARAREFVMWLERELGWSLAAYDRHADVVCARRAVALVLRSWGLSYPQVAALLRRDYATVRSLVLRADAREREIADELARRFCAAGGPRDGAPA